MAMVWLNPPLILDHVVRVPTCVGEERLRMSERPSWPLLFWPHVQSVESLRRARV